jgi:nicotinic acid mononucleotide adenylyltransferase
MDVSATAIRETVEQHQQIENLVSPAVAAYIEKYQLYRKSE